MSLVHHELAAVKVGMVMPHLVHFLIDLAHALIVVQGKSFLQRLKVLSRHIAQLCVFLVIAGMTHADGMSWHASDGLTHTIDDQVTISQVVRLPTHRLMQLCGVLRWNVDQKLLWWQQWVPHVRVVSTLVALNCAVCIFFKIEAFSTILG